jgi:RNAse (barnase) inhibitor barstar
VTPEALTTVRSMLSQHDFRVVELDGAKMTSRARAHAELARAFDFPDYYGKNWDAFNDCFGDYVEEHDGERIAVLWHRVAECAAAAPVTAIEVGWALVESSFGAMPTLAPGTRWSLQLAVFAVGVGDEFDRP